MLRTSTLPIICGPFRPIHVINILDIHKKSVPAMAILDMGCNHIVDVGTCINNQKWTTKTNKEEGHTALCI